MTKLPAGLFSLLICCSTYAQEAKDAPLPETMNIAGIVVFLVLFVGMCVGFFVYLWWKEKKKKEQGHE